MSRTILTVMLAALLVLTGTGGAAASPMAVDALTISGRLEWVTEPATPHYEVAGYILLGTTPAQLQPLMDQDVVVMGKPVTEPTIYMHKAITVDSIMSQLTYDSRYGKPALPVAPPPGSGTAPVPLYPPDSKIPGLIPAPAPERPPVTPTLPPTEPKPVPDTPVPGPAPETPAPVPTAPDPKPGDTKPAPHDLITIPAIPPVGSSVAPAPAPLYGTPYFVLFGRIEAGANGYTVVRETANGTVRTPITSSTADLAALVGQQLGIVAARDGDRYLFVAAVVLTDDVGSLVKLGADPIYTAPAEAISVKLHGQAVTMDQYPILGNSRTLVPLRAIGEALGARVSWNDATRTATVALGAREVAVTLGTNRVVIREAGKADQTIYCDTAPVVAGGRTLVPVRALAESLGLAVGWDESTHTVTLD